MVAGPNLFFLRAISRRQARLVTVRWASSYAPCAATYHTGTSQNSSLNIITLITRLEQCQLAKHRYANTTNFQNRLQHFIIEQSSTTVLVAKICADIERGTCKYKKNYSRGLFLCWVLPHTPRCPCSHPHEDLDLSRGMGLPLCEGGGRVAGLDNGSRSPTPQAQVLGVFS